MRIAYLTANDPADRRSWSGTQYHMARALEKHCGDVCYIGPLPLLSAKVGKVVSRGLRKLGVTYLYTHTASISRKLGRLAEAKLADCAYDVIFAPAGSVVLANLHTDVPVVYLSDATQRLLVGYYDEFTGMSKGSLRTADDLEQRAVRMASACVYPSSWAADSAVRDYGADPSRAHVVPFGANVDEWPDRDRAVAAQTGGVCKLLFVGREWQRKGGDIAFETLVGLERLGIPAELTVVGCRPPEGFEHQKMSVIPFLNKNNPEQREQFQRLYFESHFALLPTRAECFSIALCEASAYGLPIASTYTGGLPELVVNGANGFLLAPEARGDEYAARIKEIYQEPNGYRALRASSREQFETRLNWDAWGRRLQSILEAACSGGMAKTA